MPYADNQMFCIRITNLFGVTALRSAPSGIYYNLVIETKKLEKDD